MAKTMKRILVMCLVLAFSISMIATPTKAAPWGDGWGGNSGGWGGGWGNDYSDQYEWYQVYVQGNLVASGQGAGGNMYYLGTHYTAGINASGPIVTWYITPHGGNAGSFSGTADLRNFITVPEGFTVKDYEIEESSVEGVNSAAGSAYFDNAIIKITIKTIYNEQTGEEIEIPTEPDPTEPVPVETKVTVNHTYSTHDVYTGNTVVDGSTSSVADATEGDIFTAAAVATYNGNSYIQQTDASELTITVKADAAANVINIEYLRTIDTTPAATKVVVNHSYATYDIYTGQTVADGTVSNSADVTEGDIYTAIAVTAYNGSIYAQQTDASALTITVKADAAENVINIEYLRTIDTTPVATKVTVNHTYATHDVYTGNTVVDGSTTSSADVTEGDIYTAAAVATYNGNTYSQKTDASALTITVQADAAANVINIEYLRTIDTTPVETKVTVNHTYATYDVYTGSTVVDGTVTRSVKALEGDIFSTTAVTTYNGNSYEMQTAASALTITVHADVAENVINIEYLRTIDTTPVATKVTVNHKYSTYDVYTGQTVLDGSTSSVADVTEGDIYTAAAVASYNGNHYEMKTDASTLTITVKADAAANVINIEYLRTIDTTPVNYTPVLNVVKTANQTSYKEGETVSWTITVKNVSSYTAYDVAVTDELTGDRWSIAELAGGAQQSFTATLENAPAGTVKNVAVVSWTDGDEIPDGEEPKETKTTTDEEIVNVRELINHTPVLIVEKLADKATYEHGETITWNIAVWNVSGHTAYDVVVTDELTGDSWHIDALEPFRFAKFTATTENAEAGSLKNVVDVTWEDRDEIPDEEEPNEIKGASAEEIVSILDPAPENFTPVVSVVKTAEKDTYKEDEIITWTITVKNVSDYTAYDVVIVDELAKGYWTIDALEPGAEQVFTVTMENVAAGSVKNTVVATWNDGDEIPDEDETNEINQTSDEEIVIVEERENFTPVLSVVKTADKATYEVGETITWTITVKNVSEHTAHGVEILDEMVGGYWLIHTLEPGAERSFVVNMEAKEAGTLKNTVVVSWDDGDEIPTEEENEEIKDVTDEEIVDIKEPTPVIPDPVDPRPTEPAPTEDDEPVAQDDEIEIPDEDVPLANAPKTGDISALWILLAGISGGGMLLLGKKREDDEE